MKLNKPIECSGFFWLPNSPTHRLPGILQISETGAVELRMTYLSERARLPSEGIALGDPALNETSPNFERIIGIVKHDNTNKYITLEECFYMHNEVSFGGGIIHSIIYANRAFIGIAYDEVDKIVFSEFRFSFSGLDEWLNLSGVIVNHAFGNKGEFSKVTVEYEQPNKLSYCLPNDMNMEINFNSTIPTGFDATKVQITQKAHISLISNDLIPLSDFIVVCSILRDFFSFCIGKSIDFDTLTGYSNEYIQKGRERNYRIPVNIFYQGARILESGETPNRHSMLVSFQHVQDRFEDAIVRWFNEYTNYKPSFDLYFSSKVGTNQAIESIFLSKVQCIEALHRRKFAKTVMPHDDFQDMLSSILNDVSENRREFVKSRLQYANEPPLAKRLAEMYSKYWDRFYTTQDQKKFVRRIVDARNYYTHFENKLEGKIDKGVQLMYLCDNLEALFELYLLDILGLSEENIDQILQDSNKIRQRLVVHSGK
ncbi:MAG: hypothetical protein F4204_01965 [Rhodospirillaceae bacterium]|nr:hypothetical protein [Rhodospirillaceae bacterium]